jgi:hypothetical protein
MRRAIHDQQALRRKLDPKARGDGKPVIPGAMPSPEHYHLIYTVPKLEQTFPSFDTRFHSSREAYEQIKKLADRAEPNVEYYDEGPVGMEVRLIGRADAWWVLFDVAACLRSRCGID